MAKYTIAHTCGHTEDVQIYGPEKERPGKKAWMESQDCIECKRTKATLGAQEWAQKRGLIALQGSEKQIAWAEKIRKQLIEGVEVLVEASANDENTDEKLMGEIFRTHAWILRQTAAGWWIKKNEGSATVLLRDMLAQLQAKEAKVSF